MSSTQSNWYVRFGCLAPIIGIAALFYFIKRDAIPSRLYILRGVLRVCRALFSPYQHRTEEKMKAKQMEYVNTFEPKSSKYVESHAFIADDLLSKIAVDEKNRRIYFWEPHPSSMGSL